MINIGIIGCGKITQVRHLPEYRNRSDIKIKGVFDLNKERAEKIAKEIDAKVYGSYQELLADESIDAVSVCTANHTHATISIEALNANKHVLCEKPMAITLEECEKMKQVAKDKKRVLMIGHNQRLTKAHQLARKLVLQKEIGEIVSFRVTFGHSGPETWTVDPGKDSWFFNKEKAKFGAMGDLGIHKTDLIQFLTGQRIKSVLAKVKTIDKSDAQGNLIAVDDNAFCMYTLESGATGTMHASWTFYGQEDNSTILYGTEGIMRIYDDPLYGLKVITKDGEKILYELEKIQTNDNQTSSGVIDAFIESILNPTSPHIPTEEITHAMKAVFASITSSEQGKEIVIIEEGEK